MDLYFYEKNIFSSPFRLMELVKEIEKRGLLEKYMT